MAAKSYQEFLQEKVCVAGSAGIEAGAINVNPRCKPHQRDVVEWAVRGGRRAIFAAFGLGKTSIQLETLRILRDFVGGNYLITCPLGMKVEFSKESKALYGSNILTFIRRNEDVNEEGLYITNYESIRDGNLSPKIFTGISLDEASILRSLGSKTYHEFTTILQDVRFRFVATATPSPNHYREILHYAEVLGIMDVSQARTRFFKRNSEKAGDLQLHPHKEDEFWLWVSTWALFLQKPSDLGYSDEGYDLPPLVIHKHSVRPAVTTKTFDRKSGQGILVDNFALDLKGAAREKVASLPVRIKKMVEIVAEHPDAHHLIWHNLEAERHAIQEALPDVAVVYGSQDLEDREAIVQGFSDGSIKDLATKQVLSGSGCNFQRYCHIAIFLGVDYKFNDFIQSIHRIYRFLQTETVEIHVIHSEAEKGVLEVLFKKWEQHKKLVAKMTEIIKKYGLAHAEIATQMSRSMGVERREAIGESWRAVNNDCVLETQSMPENSVDMILTSIPFSGHYEYTPLYNDFGHTENNDHFWRQMDFLTPELLRVLRPGRVAAIHVKDDIFFGASTGYGFPSVSPLHAEAIFHYRKHGFIYFGMITIVTDVVRENNQTYRLGWTEQCKDGTKMGVGSPEYVLLFRKIQSDRTRGYADVPVLKSKKEYSRAQWQIDAHGFWRSNGDRPLMPEELESLPLEVIMRLFKEHSARSVYDYSKHVEISQYLEEKGKLPYSFMAVPPASTHSAVWDDVTRMRTLNTLKAQRGRETHICPLQFDIVERLISRYMNKGEVVLDPFGGLMTVPYSAVKLGRKGVGIELNPTYYTEGVRYLKEIEVSANSPTLFSLAFLEAGGG